MNFKISFLFAFLCFIGIPTARAQQPLSLAGKWQVQLDPDSTGLQKKYFEKTSGEVITLPGTLIGVNLTFAIEYC